MSEKVSDEAIEALIECKENSPRASADCHRCSAVNTCGELDDAMLLRELLAYRQAAQADAETVRALVGEYGICQEFDIDDGVRLVQYALSRLSAGKKQSPWISVMDRLPSIDEYVLWTHENGSIFQDAIDKDWDGAYLRYFFDGFGRKELCGPITHWMKPPVAPSGKEYDGYAISDQEECPFCGPDGTISYGGGETICSHCGGSHILKPSGQDEALDIALDFWNGAALPRSCAEKQAKAIRDYGFSQRAQGRAEVADQCPSCHCVVDLKGHGHHSVSDCAFMRMVSEGEKDQRAQGRRDAAEIAIELIKRSVAIGDIEVIKSGWQDVIFSKITEIKQ
jgi:hypothetical protein